MQVADSRCALSNRRRKANSMRTILSDQGMRGHQSLIPSVTVVPKSPWGTPASQITCHQSRSRSPRHPNLVPRILGLFAGSRRWPKRQKSRTQGWPRVPESFPGSKQNWIQGAEELFVTSWSLLIPRIVESTPYNRVTIVVKSIAWRFDCSRSYSTLQ